MAKTKVKKNPVDEFIKAYEEDIFAGDLTDKEVDRIFIDVSGIDGIQDLLRSILKKDRVRFFNSHPNDQPVIRGAFLRTMWLLQRMKKAVKPKASPVKLTSPRHENASSI